MTVNTKNRTDSDIGCLTPLAPNMGGVSPSIAGKSDAGKSEFSSFGQSKLAKPKLNLDFSS